MKNGITAKVVVDTLLQCLQHMVLDAAEANFFVFRPILLKSGDQRDFGVKWNVARELPGD